MQPNNLVREKRISRGLDESVIAANAGLTIDEYSDIEDYEDELFTVVPLVKVYRICAQLNISLNELFNVEPRNSDLPRDVVRQRMRALDVSVASLADVVGVTEESIRDVADDFTHLVSWVMEPLTILAESLGINAGDILAGISKVGPQ